VGRTCLVGGHHEGVNVTLFRGIAVREVRFGWIQQFRSHVTDNSRLGCGCATWLHDGGIGDNTRDSEVSKARIALFSDKDIPLDRTRLAHISIRESRSSLTGLISPCTMLSECRYSRPQAACASYRGRSLSQFVSADNGIAHKLQSINPPIFLNVFDNISV
jgi:hypothetical protein